MRGWIGRVGTMAMFVTTLGGGIEAQAPRQPARPGEAAVEGQAPSAPPRTFDDANETREKLNQVMRQYPPSVVQVLRLDPSLLNDPRYLSTYPALGAFVAAHPEVVHNPAFYFGQARDWEHQGPRNDAVRMWEGMFQSLTIFAVFATVAGMLAWLLRTVIDYRRWLRLAKVQAEFHGKLLDRLTGSEDLIAYMGTAAGRRFLESAPIPLDAGPRAISAPVTRILWSIQAGCVLALGGIGLQFVSGRVVDEVAQPLFVIGIVAMALGAGFIVSAVVSYLLSKQLGLFEPPGAVSSDTRTPGVSS
jgi:hypothetical protein